MIPSVEHQRTLGRGYQNGEDQSQHKDLINSDHIAADPNAGSAHFLTPEMLAHHRALVAVTSGNMTSVTQSSSLVLSSAQDSSTQQLFQAAMARNQTPPSSSSPSSAAYYSHHPHQSLSTTDTTSALLHRFSGSSVDPSLPPVASTSSSSSLTPSSLDQQRLALAAYWQAHTLGEIMSRNQAGGLASENNSFTTTSELAAIAAAAAATNNEDSTRQLLSTLGCHGETKVKVPSVHSVRSQQRDSSPSSWTNHSGLVESDHPGGQHQPTMLPETCIPLDMARSHVANSEGTT